MPSTGPPPDSRAASYSARIAPDAVPASVRDFLTAATACGVFATWVALPLTTVLLEAAPDAAELPVSAPAGTIIPNDSAAAAIKPVWIFMAPSHV
jgi:hypothetical protein